MTGQCDWPYQVKLPIPTGELGNRLDEMHRNASEIDADHKTRGGHRRPDDYRRFCFRERLAAESFQARFSGDLTAPPTG